MSKLFKELNYDTDRVMQPGDSLTSPDGNVSVSANIDGTATLRIGTITKTLATENYVNGMIGDIDSVLDGINGEVV